MKTIKYYHKNSDVVAFKKETYSDGYSYESTYDEKGNVLTYKDLFNYSEEHTYDENGNKLTFKDSNGCSYERTYDENGNQLTYKDSEGFSCERTYDENGKVLTYKNSNGSFMIKGKIVTKEEFESFIHNQKKTMCW